MSKEYVTKDSGARQEFGTGSVRDLPTGKGRYDLIPTEPLRRLAGLYERGAAKYGDRNWEKGQPLMRYIDSMMRHVNCLVAGEPEEDHAAAIAWNAFGYMQTLAAIEAGRLPGELDNRPAPEPQYTATPPVSEAADAQLELPITEPDGPLAQAFTPDEEQWFRTGEPLKVPTPAPETEQLTRCNDPHCQMCPLEQSLAKAFTRRGRGQ